MKAIYYEATLYAKVGYKVLSNELAKYDSSELTDLAKNYTKNKIDG